ncbi:unnamed protein product [Chrysoparadoxa australica]
MRLLVALSCLLQLSSGFLQPPPGGHLQSPVVVNGKFNKRVPGGDEGEEIDYYEGGHLNKGSIISWYPGHIAKAERSLQSYIKMVDVVVEVRDARIPWSTTHPMVPEWVGNRPLLVVFNRVDCAPAPALGDWMRFYSSQKGMSSTGRAGNVPVFFVDSKHGKQIHNVKRAVIRAGARVNERRIRRGINPRSVRVAVIGFPNVGKSALINRLVGKRVAQSRNIPGVTKKINWIRVNGKDERPEEQLELLDSPGIIPAKQNDQSAALKLAICNDIGQASYDTQVVAAAMLDMVVDTAVQFPGYVNIKAIEERYGIDPRRHSGEEFLYLMAQKFYSGEMNSAADKMLGDFRKGFYGNVALEAPPTLNAGNSARLEGLKQAPAAAFQEEGEVEEYGASVKAERVFVREGQGDFEGW